ncbi:hypothetical protein VDP25_03265 [Winogradskyella sp. ECml5-4]|uniref:hypothetical protein n=1 Tax=Winogradskyella sp. ECml5-4 TaxID=3110975 RepID=UPI002FF3954E
MNKKTKSIIIGGLVSGIVYAGLMAGFDYYDGNEFKIWRFLWNFFFFGGVMSLLTGYNVRKQSENKGE